MDGYLLLHNHPNGNTNPSPEDLEVAARLVAKSPCSGFGITDSCLERLYLVWTPAIADLVPAGDALEGAVSGER